LDLSTGTTNGVDDPFGTQDGKWRLSQVPSSTYGQLPGLFPIGFYPAFSTASLAGSWAPDPIGANWIHPQDAPVVNSGGFWHVSSKGFYQYRLLFDLPAGAYTTLTLAGVHAEDDQGKFFLNGNQIIPGGGNLAGNFATLTPFSYASVGLGFFQIGINELVFEVENGAAVTGLLLRADLQTTCAPPVAPFDLATQKTAVNLPWVVGGQGTFEIQVSNLGPTAISQGTVTMEDLLPVQFQPPLVITQGGSLWNCATTAVGLQYKVTCTWPANVQNVPVGPMPLISITGLVRALPMVNCADVTLTGSSLTETNLSNNHACVTVT
jgi:uncharacterized repeat protein (TIGR01451 family)